jgi:hypothetical protein
MIADAEVVDSRLDDPAERRVQLLRTTVVLTECGGEEPDADAGRR